MASHLILVRHSISRQRADVSSHEWELTPEGRERCEALAERLRDYEPGLVASSAEPKARQTAELVAARLGLEASVEPELGEHRRKSEPWLASTSEFEARIRALLQRPGQLVYGEETGDAAADRLQAALDGLVTRHAGQTVVAVTHGTVMSLYLARVAGLDAVRTWEGLGMPAYAVLRLPGLELLELVNDLG
ncbi:MAG: histidine phosphatase family protein [Dehalococcoidia bacterium]